MREHTPREQGVPAQQTAGPEPKRVRHQAGSRLRQLLPLAHLIIATLRLNLSEFIHFDFSGAPLLLHVVWRHNRSSVQSHSMQQNCAFSKKDPLRVCEGASHLQGALPPSHVHTIDNHSSLNYPRPLFRKIGKKSSSIPVPRTKDKANLIAVAMQRSDLRHLATATKRRGYPPRLRMGSSPLPSP